MMPILNDRGRNERCVSYDGIEKYHFIPTCILKALYFKLSVSSDINCIAARCLTISRHVPLSSHDDVALFE